MVRVGVSVEGPTEERFMKRVLSPYLAQKNIYVTPISMGGDVKLDRVKSELKSIAFSYDYVTTFYDFYGFKGKSLGETKDTLEQKILSHAHSSIQPKLVPYIQMYEFEGLLFSYPDLMQAGLAEDGVESWATTVLNEFHGNPEKINDSPQTAPSRRLESKTGYRKTTHGPNIAELIGIERLRQRCSGFNEWLNKIESLCVSD